MTDPRADARRFDPRFDPAFQPGYDPRNDPSSAARSRPDRFDAPPTRLTPPDRTGAAEYPPSTQPPRSAHRLEDTAADADDSDLDALLSESETADEPPAGRGVNPFAVTLWVVSVVLISAGITVFRSIPGLEQQGSFSTGPGTSVSFGQVASLSVLGPILIGSGVLVGAGNLFLLASRWPRNRS